AALMGSDIHAAASSRFPRNVDPHEVRAIPTDNGPLRQHRRYLQLRLRPGLTLLPRAHSSCRIVSIRTNPNKPKTSASATNAAWSFGLRSLVAMPAKKRTSASTSATTTYFVVILDACCETAS